jgi:hypothetical protein
VELLADRGEGDVDDRVVDEREKNAQAQDGEYRPPPGMHPVGAGWRCPSSQPSPRPTDRCFHRGSPGSPNVHVVMGATGDRSNAVDVAISLSEDLLRGK